MPESHDEAQPDAVAIIGGACRFSDIEGIDRFWTAVAQGQDLTDRTQDGATSADGLVRAGGTMAGADCFDAAVFGMAPREALLTDPQQRVFLESCRHAFEYAGHDPQRFDGVVGVFGGTGPNTYLPALSAHTDARDWDDLMGAAAGNEKDFLAPRVSYRLGLTGPSISVQTACSTSLVAVHLACQSLMDFECDMAVAGGSSLMLNRHEGYRAPEGGILSPQGRCRPFDEAASGTVPSDGTAVVVLRRLQDAVADGDTIIAVIRGSAVRHDGDAKVGFTAPGVNGQLAAIRAACAAAGVDPATVDLVEAHGTGTELGDSVEFAALKEAYGRGRGAGNPCRVTAVKSMLGHTDSASGVAGLLSAALSLQAGVMPGITGFTSPRADLKADGSGLELSGTARPWPAGSHPRRAGVSSVGLGGTNAHVVLEEAPPRPCTEPRERWEIVPLSAHSPAALHRARAGLRAHLEHGAQDTPALGDIAHTLQTGRSPMPYRMAAVARGQGELLAKLAHDKVHGSGELPGRADRPVIFLFPGGGAQHAAMAHGLYAGLPVFREALRGAVAEVADQLAPRMARWFRGGMEPAEAHGWVDGAALGLPALFLVEYALASSLIELGLEPAGMLGHSLGEYAAACHAGVLSLPDAFTIVRQRARLLGSLPEGAMLSVPLPPDEVRQLLGEGHPLDMAAVNSPHSCVVTGRSGAVRRFAAQLGGQGIETALVPLATPAHSREVDAVADEFRAVVSGLRLARPHRPFISDTTGQWADPDVVATPDYWVRHLRDTVQFGRGLRTALAVDEAPVLIEVGPGRTLTSLARRAVDHTALVRALCGHRDDPRPQPELYLTAVADIWAAGRDIRWEALREEPARRVPLPLYPFERTRYAVGSTASGPSGQAGQAGRQAAAASQRSGGAEVRALGWRRHIATATGPGRGEGAVRLLLSDGSDPALAAALEASGAIRPTSVDALPADVTALHGGGPVELICLVGLGTGSGPAAGYRENLMAAARLGRAITSCEAGSVRLTLLTDGLYDLNGAEPVTPAKAPYLGLCQMLEAEAGGRARAVDVRGNDMVSLCATTEGAARTVARLLDESLPLAVALRGQSLWVGEEIAQAAPESLDADGLPERPVVLITGGFGGVGAALAGHLARTRKARLALVSRSGATRAGDVLRTLEKTAGFAPEVLPLAADVSVAAQARDAVERTVARFGRIDLVVHAAAVPFGAMLQLWTQEGAAELHGAKVDGAMALAEAVREWPEATLALTSARQPKGGAVGSFDYTSANAFLDMLAQDERRSGRRVMSIAWDRWRGVGMARALEKRHAELTGDTTLRGMDLARAAEAFDGCLVLAASGESLATVVAVGPDAAGTSPADGAPNGGAEAALPVPGRHARDPGLGPRQDPSGELETALAEIWGSVLNIEGVGSTDNFFALGGDSLTGMQIATRVRSAFGHRISIRDLFGSPTVRALAAALEQRGPA